MKVGIGPTTELASKLDFRHAKERDPIHCPHHEEKNMTSATVHREGNAVARVPSRSPDAIWPPPWLSSLPSQPSITPEAEPAQADDSVAPVAACAEFGAWDLAMPVEGVQPCQKCGSLETWWDCNGKPHCQQCEPIRRALALADLAARIRSRKPFPEKKVLPHGTPSRFPPRSRAP